jgi:hypothetical protein
MLCAPKLGGAMAKTRTEIDTILDELERELDVLRKEDADQDDFWMALMALSDAIEAETAPEDLDYVRKRFDFILALRS